MITITKPLPRPPVQPVDQVKAGMNAARILRQRADSHTLTEGDAERLMDKIDRGFAAALALVASSPSAGQPFRVIKGGRAP